MGPNAARFHSCNGEMKDLSVTGKFHSLLGGGLNLQGLEQGSCLLLYCLQNIVANMKTVLAFNLGPKDPEHNVYVFLLFLT